MDEHPCSSRYVRNLQQTSKKLRKFIRRSMNFPKVQGLSVTFRKLPWIWDNLRQIQRTSEKVRNYPNNSGDFLEPWIVSKSMRTSPKFKGFHRSSGNLWEVESLEKFRKFTNRSPNFLEVQETFKQFREPPQNSGNLQKCENFNAVLGIPDKFKESKMIRQVQETF